MARLRRLSFDIVEISRIEQGTAQIHPVDLDLQTMLKDLEARWSQRCASVGITLDVKAPKVKIVGDPDRVEQVISNLIDNAIRHTPPNGKIKVSARRDGQVARIRPAPAGPTAGQALGSTFGFILPLVKPRRRLQPQ